MIEALELRIIKLNAIANDLKISAIYESDPYKRGFFEGRIWSIEMQVAELEADLRIEKHTRSIKRGEQSESA